MSGPGARETTGPERALTEFLERFADHDEQWAGGLRREVAVRLTTLARPAPGDACLDVGGGAGMVAALLSESVGPAGLVVSIDARGCSVEVAHLPTAGNTYVMRMRGDDVFFRDHSLDVVVLSRSIAYEDDAQAIIAEASRTLKLGGRLALFCRRRGLGTPAERVFLDELAMFVHEQPVTMPDRFFAYPGLADRADIEAALTAAGFGRVGFGDVVSGGRAGGAAEWNNQMMACWPAARILIGALAGEKRQLFDRHIGRVMRDLGDDAFRYHHAYLLATAVKDGDPMTEAATSTPLSAHA
jgi:SAM-dependent methyltransferase